jgi:hypothetical protein
VKNALVEQIENQKQRRINNIPTSVQRSPNTQNAAAATEMQVRKRVAEPGSR